MASFDNLMMAMDQPWGFRPAYDRETDCLTKALQRSIAGDVGGDVFSAEVLESLFAAPVQTPAASGCSEEGGSAARTRRGAAVPPTSGRVAKRKSRATKRATTTFITADAANFREMVQQVTGVRFAGNLPAGPVVKPEPYRAAIGRMQSLPATLDTSAYLMDGGAAVAAPPPAVEYDAFCSFPTLESWKVM